jgi:hypothetical protein
MTHSPETGHAKNAANFNRLVALCQNFGSRYNPSNPNISVANLQTLATTANITLSEIIQKAAIHQTNTDKRFALFEKLPKLSTTALNLLAASGATEKTVKNAKSINAKIQGKRIKPLVEEEENTTNTQNPDNSNPNLNNSNPNLNNSNPNLNNSNPNLDNSNPNLNNSNPNLNNSNPILNNSNPNLNNSNPNLDNKTNTNTTQNNSNNTNPAAETNSNPETTNISVSQRSYDNLTQHLYKFIQLLQNEPKYTPNELEYQPSTLQTLFEDMNTLNQAVYKTALELESTRITRNELFYKSENSLYTAAQEAKAYIKAIFGSTSPQYLQAIELVFTKTKD